MFGTFFRNENDAQCANASHEKNDFIIWARRFHFISDLVYSACETFWVSGKCECCSPVLRAHVQQLNEVFTAFGALRIEYTQTVTKISAALSLCIRYDGCVSLYTEILDYMVFELRNISRSVSLERVPTLLEISPAHCTWGREHERILGSVCGLSRIETGSCVHSVLLQCICSSQHGCLREIDESVVIDILTRVFVFKVSSRLDLAAALYSDVVGRVIDIASDIYLDTGDTRFIGFKDDVVTLYSRQGKSLYVGGVLTFASYASICFHNLKIEIVNPQVAVAAGVINICDCATFSMDNCRVVGKLGSCSGRFLFTGGELLSIRNSDAVIDRCTFSGLSTYLIGSNLTCRLVVKRCMFLEYTDAAVLLRGNSSGTFTRCLFQRYDASTYTYYALFSNSRFQVRQCILSGESVSSSVVYASY